LKRFVSACVVWWGAACGSSAAPVPVHAPPDAGYVKGALHVHSNNSGDSQTPPADVARWYRAHGFDFVVFTDHNRITTLASADGLIVFPGVELTQNLETCDPPPTPADVRCLLHVNALMVTDTSVPEVRWSLPPGVPTRLARYSDALARTEQLGGIAQLNHPNFHWGADAALIEQLVASHGLKLFEVANQSSDVANEGDATHVSTEALWDRVLSDGYLIYGTATDDAHHYDDADAVRARGEVPDVGDQGWVMVHAGRDPEAIKAALGRGDFYSSTGVTLTRIAQSADALVVAATEACDFAFIGKGGAVLARSHGTQASFPLGQVHGEYVRAVVTDAKGKKAWVQPVRVP
jgi:hypothetical protein